MHDVLPPHRHPRLSTYTAALATVVATSAASGQVIYTALGPVDGALFDGDNIAGTGVPAGGNDIVIPIDFDQDGNVELNVSYEEASVFGQPPSLSIKIQGDPFNAPNMGEFNIEDEILVDRTALAGDANNPLALPFGSIIDDADNGTTRSWQFIGLTGPSDDPAASNSISGIANGDGGGNFDLGDPAHYVGVRTLIDGNTHYGWIGVVITAQNDGTPSGEKDTLEGFVTGYAYNATPGAGLAAGVIPEPSSALLALGAAGLTMLRRR